MESCTGCICVYVDVCVSIFYVYKWYMYVMCIHTNIHICMHAWYIYICAYIAFSFRQWANSLTFHNVHCKHTRPSKVCSLCAERKKKNKLAQSTKNTCSTLWVLSFRKGRILGISLEFQPQESWRRQHTWLWAMTECVFNPSLVTFLLLSLTSHVHRFQLWLYTILHLVVVMWMRLESLMGSK